MGIAAGDGLVCRYNVRIRLDFAAGLIVVPEAGRAADAVTNQVYVPIPAGVSTVCSSKGGNDANGCIAVFKSPNDDMFKKLADRDDKRGDHH
jgi:hypothetical protein